MKDWSEYLTFLTSTFFQEIKEEVIKDSSSLECENTDPSIQLSSPSIVRLERRREEDPLVEKRWEEDEREGKKSWELEIWRDPEETKMKSFWIWELNLKSNPSNLISIPSNSIHEESTIKEGIPFNPWKRIEVDPTFKWEEREEENPSNSKEEDPFNWIPISKLDLDDKQEK